MRSAIEILGLQEHATEKDIRAAYHRLVQIYHPDRFHGSSQDVQIEAERYMTELNVAYKELRDRNFIVGDADNLPSRSGSSNQSNSGNSPTKNSYDPSDNGQSNPLLVEWRFGYVSATVIALDSTYNKTNYREVLKSALESRNVFFTEDLKNDKLTAKIANLLIWFPCEFAFEPQAGYTTLRISHTRHISMVYQPKLIVKDSFGQAVRRLGRAMGAPANDLPKQNSII